MRVMSVMRPRVGRHRAAPPWRDAAPCSACCLALAWVVLLALAAALPATAQTTEPVSVLDDRGITVRLAKPAGRIVSMLPSLTETVCELGACTRLVGVDRYSNFPLSLQSLPKLGGLDDANVESIVALKPDLVLLAQSARIIDRLEALGLTVVVLEPRSQDDVHRVLAQVGALVGSTAADAAWRRIQAGVDSATRQIDPAARGLSVYFEVASGPYAAGEVSFAGETLARLGLRNIVPASLGPFPKLNPEFVVRADPALILVSQRNASGLAGRPGWERIRAMRERRICRFDADAGDVLARPGPRMGEAALLMARCINQALAAAPLLTGPTSSTAPLPRP